MGNNFSGDFSLKNSKILGLITEAEDFACLCLDGLIVFLNDKALHMLGREGGFADDPTGSHFNSLVHEADHWTLDSWWPAPGGTPVPGMGARGFCRLGSPEAGWSSLELTCANHWIGGRQYQIILGRNNAKNPVNHSRANAIGPKLPRAEIIKHAAVLRRERVKRKWAERNLRRLAYQDHLTGLINRAYFQSRLKNTLGHAERFDRTVSLLVIDIDNFKDINDRYGAAAGDMVLQQAAQRLRQCMRVTDTVARLGGDEFCVLISSPGATRIVDAMAQKISAVMTEPFFISDQALSITCSIGASIYPRDAKNPETLLGNAQIALSGAKRDGSRDYQLFDAALNEQVRLRRQLEDELNDAIHDNQLRLHYQPQVDINTGLLRGVEALVRWQHPVRGMIPPVMFVPMAETSGLILPMTEWVMKTAASDMRRCLDQGLDIERVSVNLSANLLLHKDLAGLIRKILKETGLPPKRFEVEITETMVMEDIEKSSMTINSLYLLGIGLALDDFGTGYSSLTYLRQFPLSTLKIDRSFITEMSENAEDIAIVRAVIALAHSLHLRVIAEGVENEKQLHILRQENCDQVQGYYYSKPLPLEDLVKWARARKSAQISSNVADIEIRSAG
ncbi:MAG TPA: EAL domain-containing protein [Alphaproteobacteria bacterium]|nr:EAL domain-containing protein [Alphaproteobacteria bacterium]